MTLEAFAIIEGTEEEAHAQLLQYVPFFRFQLYPLLSFDQVEKIINAM